MRALAMQIDADRMHLWASPRSGLNVRPGHSAPGTRSLGGPLLHDINGVGRPG
jgi:hypothetical protein